jgi:hypothetical protein
LEELVSLITGLIGLAIVNRSEEGRRLFYEGSNEADQLGCLKLLVISLIGLPFALFLNCRTLNYRYRRMTINLRF